MTLAIVDELAAYSAMHLLFGIRKIANGNGGPGFAEAVGENPIVEDWPSQINDRSFGRVERTNAFDVNRFPGRVWDRHLDIAEWLVRISAQVINQIGLPV